MRIFSTGIEQSPRAAVDEIGMRLTAPRLTHQREGHEWFTLDRILAEEMVVTDLVDAQNPRAMLWVKDADANVLVLAPTGKAVDVAMREGAGDTGLTVAKALQSLRDLTRASDRLHYPTGRQMTAVTRFTW